MPVQVDIMIKFWNCLLDFPSLATSRVYTAIMQNGVLKYGKLSWFVLASGVWMWSQYKGYLVRETPHKMSSQLYSEAGCICPGKDPGKTPVTEAKVKEVGMGPGGAFTRSSRNWRRQAARKINMRALWQLTKRCEIAWFLNLKMSIIWQYL